jgi:hypothetical protein
MLLLDFGMKDFIVRHYKMTGMCHTDKISTLSI